MADETLPSVLWCELEELAGPALLMSLDALREVCVRSATAVLLIAEPSLLGARLDDALRAAGRPASEAERLLAPYLVCAQLDAGSGGHLARLFDGSERGESEASDPLAGFESEFPVLEPGAERVLRALEPLAPSSESARRLALSWLRLRMGLGDRDRAALDGGPQSPPERGVALAMLAAVLADPAGARGLALELARIENAGTWGELVEHLKSVAASRRDLSPELLTALAQGLEASASETRQVPLARARAWYATAQRCAR